ncbi:hypothetical protein BKA83DRAFT_4481683 [Pisolithus microcarpus]|nr:hypothetical protein BKA83DRAFT_4481683 [Pisolithus microcarpus]
MSKRCVVCVLHTRARLLATISTQGGTKAPLRCPPKKMGSREELMGIEDRRQGCNQYGELQQLVAVRLGKGKELMGSERKTTQKVVCGAQDSKACRDATAPSDLRVLATTVQDGTKAGPQIAIGGGSEYGPKQGGDNGIAVEVARLSEEETRRALTARDSVLILPAKSTHLITCTSETIRIEGKIVVEQTYIILPIDHVGLSSSSEGIQHPFTQLTSSNWHPSLTLRVVLLFKHTAYLLKIKSPGFIFERSSLRRNPSSRNGRSTRRCIVYPFRSQETYEGFEGFVGKPSAVCSPVATEGVGIEGEAVAVSEFLDISGRYSWHVTTTLVEQHSQLTRTTFNKLHQYISGVFLQSYASGIKRRDPKKFDTRLSYGLNIV